MKPMSLPVALLFMGSVSTAPQAHADSTAQISVTGRIRPASCTIATQDVSVNLPDVTIGDLSAIPIGGTLSASGQNTLQFNCPTAGTSVHITLTDSTNPGSTAPYLALINPDQKERGVGIQMFCADDTPIPLNQEALCLAGHRLPQGPYQQSVRARYYRTAATLTGGSVLAKAIFNVDFD